MASIGLRGQNEYAYCTSNTILRLVFETKFCPKINGLGVKVEQTHRHFSQLYTYIDVSKRNQVKLFKPKILSAAFFL